MKKEQRIRRDFDKLRQQLSQISYIARQSKDSNLWNHEASVRKKIKELKNYKDKQLKEYDAVLSGYLALLDEISLRLLRQYNKKKGTDYRFDEIIGRDINGYISSGLISVLVTSHIPKLMAEEFSKNFPENPKDE